MLTPEEWKEECQQFGRFLDWEVAKVLCPEDFPGPNPHERPVKHVDRDGNITWTTGYIDFGPGPHPKRTVAVIAQSEQTLIIPGRFPALNEVLAAARTHWSVYHKEKRRYTEKVALLARAARLKPVQHPVVICFRWVEKDKKRDKDNLRAACKFVLDGLAEAGILPTDGWRWIAGFEDRFEVDKKNPRIEVTIREIEP